MRWKAVMDWLPTGIIITDDKKQIIHINQEMRSYVPEIINTPGIQVNTSTDLEKDKAEYYVPAIEALKDRNNREKNLRTYLESQDNLSSSDQVYNLINEKTEKVYEVKISSLPNSWPAGFKFAVVKDQTLYENLIKKDIIERHQKMLISSITHEIRNPLNIIDGYNNMINEYEGNITVKKYCNTITATIKKIDFILDGACELIHSDSDVVQYQTFNLEPAIYEVIQVISPQVESKSLNIKVNFGQEAPEQVKLDRKKYQVILFHLLSNAAKYTREGEIELNIKYSPETYVLTTIVNDTGIGISKEKLPKLFELYGKIDNANKFNPQGMSLGLGICNKLVNALGGKIDAISDIGIGSTFSFTCLNQITILKSPHLSNCFEENKNGNFQNILIFNSDCVNPSNTAEEKNEFKLDNNPIGPSDICIQKKCSCPEFLIVDDEPTNRAVIKSYLKSENWYGEEAENGKIAIDKVENRYYFNTCCCQYKLIFMDINMPEMDGTEAAEKIQKFFEKQLLEPTKIIAVTAATFQKTADIQNLLSIGFSDVCILYFD